MAGEWWNQTKSNQHPLQSQRLHIIYSVFSLSLPSLCIKIEMNTSYKTQHCLLVIIYLYNLKSTQLSNEQICQIVENMSKMLADNVSVLYLFSYNIPSCNTISAHTNWSMLRLLKYSSEELVPHLGISSYATLCL